MEQGIRNLRGKRPEKCRMMPPLATTLRWGAQTSATSGWDCQFFAEDALDGHSPATKEFPASTEFLAFRVELRLVWNTNLIRSALSRASELQQ